MHYNNKYYIIYILCLLGQILIISITVQLSQNYQYLALIIFVVLYYILHVFLFNTEYVQSLNRNKKINSNVKQELISFFTNLIRVGGVTLFISLGIALIAFLSYTSYFLWVTLFGKLYVYAFAHFSSHQYDVSDAFIGVLMISTVVHLITVGCFGLYYLYDNIKTRIPVNFTFGLPYWYKKFILTFRKFPIGSIPWKLKFVSFIGFIGQLTSLQLAFFSFCIVYHYEWIYELYLFLLSVFHFWLTSPKTYSFFLQYKHFLSMVGLNTIGQKGLETVAKAATVGVAVG